MKMRKIVFFFLFLLSRRSLLLSSHMQRIFVRASCVYFYLRVGQGEICFFFLLSSHRIQFFLLLAFDARRNTKIAKKKINLLCSHSPRYPSLVYFTQFFLLFHHNFHEKLFFLHRRKFTTQRRVRRFSTPGLTNIDFYSSFHETWKISEILLRLRVLMTDEGKLDK